MDGCGYWLASPSAYHTNSLIYINSKGVVNYSWYYRYNEYISTNWNRPIVRVPSDILEKKKVVLPQVGDIVHYSPSGSYNWNAEYASSDQTGNTALSSSEGGNFRVTEWKVLNVNEETQKIDIVPTSPTSGQVRLQGAQGYNNAVYLLNDACSNLYSDSSKGITARSINMDDIENAMKEAGNESSIQGAKRLYNGTYSSAKYPVIYGQENYSMVNSSGTLKLSEQTRLIERNEGTSLDSYIGAITSLSSMTKPFSTDYSLSYNNFNTTLGSKGNMILPKGSSTYYWVASRCVTGGNNTGYFSVRYINSGILYYKYIFLHNRWHKQRKLWFISYSNS